VTKACSCNTSFLSASGARPGNLACSRCGGTWTNAEGAPFALDAEQAAKARVFIADGGLVVLSFWLRRVLFIQAEDVVPAPGNARMSRCPDCDHGQRYGVPCDRCGGTGVELYRACVSCRDIAMWSYGPGNDQAHMTCDLCGASWDAGHPGWLAQRVPERLLASASG